MTVLIGTSLTSCSDDDLKTGQYGGGVQLNVFGPSPVMRGGTLRFIGSNLDQINQVLIPGVSPITNIEVVRSGVPSEIRVTVPKDGPEPGIVTLVTKTDQTIKTLTPLAYSEPIEIEGFTPASAMPGEEITIKGDYLNLIHMIEFADGVFVSEKAFKSHDRYHITVVVPEEAKTGKLGLYDLDISDSENASTDVSYNIIMTEEALNVGTPTITSLASSRTANAEANETIVAKAGEEITVKGEHFNLIASIKVGEGESAVEFNDFTVAEDKNAITFKLPENAPSGDIVLVCRSTVEIPVGKLTTVKPSELKVNPTPVKNGTELTITGKDLDLVKSVTFPNADAVEVTAEETKIVVKVPETATEGDIALNMANGESATVAYELVKPTFTAYSTNKASAGGALSITGKDLDLVKSVTFTGAEPVEVEATETLINVTVPMEAKTGAVTLTLKNGMTVEFASIEVTEAVFCYAKTLPTEEEEIHAGETLTIKVANPDVLQSVEVNGEKVQHILQGERLIIAIPDNAKAGAKFKLISSNGDITYIINVIPNTEIKTVIWQGLHSAGGWANGFQALAWGGYDWSTVTPGTELVINFTVDPDKEYGCQIRFGNGSWAALPGTKQLEGADGDGNISMADDAKEYHLVLTQEMIDELQANGGLVICGAWFILNKISLVEHISLEETIWEGNHSAGGWANGFQALAWGGFDWSTVKAGKTLIVHFTVDPAKEYGCQIRFGNGSWNALPGTKQLEGADGDGNISMADDAKEYRVTLTQEMIDEMVANGGLVICGAWFILTKVGIE